MDASSSYWCYSCDRFVHPHPQAVLCPDCNAGFLEEMPPRAALSALRPRRASAADDHPPFNPVIVLRRSASALLPDDHLPAADTTTFDLFYDDASGSGLRPLPDTMSDFLMAAGFDRLLHHLLRIPSSDNPPASKAAVDSMPTILIAPCHLAADSHCAVCKEPFDLGTEAREMPCTHIYHHECILPWLALRNSCPVCRHHMPTEAEAAATDSGLDDLESTNAVEAAAAGNSDEDTTTVGLTIWRLPGGGFAVGRFAGGTRTGERELPVVYTQMDGGFNGGGSPRMIGWSSRGSRSSQRSIISRLFRNMFSCFRHRDTTADSGDYSSRAGRRSSSSCLHRQPEEPDHELEIGRWPPRCHCYMIMVVSFGNSSSPASVCYLLFDDFVLVDTSRKDMMSIVSRHSEIAA